MPTVAPISQQIWDMKYRFRGASGAPVDDTIEATWRRVARALAAGEADPAAWEEPFYEALADFRFLPAGRIVAGAGTERRVTLFNCFVMGTVGDDMASIFDNLKEAALTMQQGGGIGYDFSTLRPRGAPVAGVGADASGPLTFMDVWDAMCRTIMSAGHRRGAMMATMRCDHPDIEAFVDAKREAGRLRMFNLSVLVTDAFMTAVKADAPWDLTFNGRVYKSVQARGLWDRIMRGTYAYAEPGVIFIDRINARNNLHYCETIAATNPCVTDDTWVHTTDGPRQVADLVGQRFTALVDGRPHASGPDGFFRTGRKPVLRLTTREGYCLRLTAEHPVRKVTTHTRWRQETAWVKAGELAPGDEIVLHDHRAMPAWPSAPAIADIATPATGYLLGLLIGDGTMKADAAILSAWPGEIACNGGTARPGVARVMEAAEAAARTLPHRADFAGWMAVRERGEMRMKSAAVRNVARGFGLAPGRKDITPAIETGSSDFARAFLRGLFDADGSVQGSQVKGVSVRLAQSNLGRLQAAQRMLARLGIMATIYRERRPAGQSVLPDGKGGHAAYDTAANHELAISKENLYRFAELVGFEDSDKAARLTSLLAGYQRTPNRETFLARVEALTPDGEAEVFDVQVPGVNAFDANGVMAHNCGEQPLPPYGACLLGSVNLARLVVDPFEATAHLDLDALDKLVRTAVRMLDNAIDVSRFPLPAQAEEARAKRRMGLGVTGLADALIFCRARYGSAASVALIETWMAALRRSAYLSSAELAAEKGAFPLFEAEPYLAGESVAELDEDVREAIGQHGIRNALLTSVAPTGTISIFADNVSSGLEPVFSFTYNRSVLMPDGERRQETVTDYAYRVWRASHGEQPLPDYFVDAQMLAPADHLAVQAAVQKYVDSSISKTINCPEDIAFDDFKDIYLNAYEMGCKGCTTYRPNDVTGSVLSTADEAKPAEAEMELPFDKPALVAKPKDSYDAGGVVYMTKPLDRPEALPGSTYKINWPESDHAIYITINDVIQDGRRRPFEVFINSKNMEHFAWTVALTRMISAVFRRGGDVSFVVEELKAVFDPRGGSWMGGRYVPSLLAAIGEVIEKHMIDIGFIGGEDEKPRLALAANAGESSRLRGCPRCGEASLVRQEGCDTCVSCGYSKCG
ncbi:MAG: LAGLIDADG family homing endonuclease [Alphaproteobacteria bacterium]